MQLFLFFVVSTGSIPEKPQKHTVYNLADFLYNDNINYYKQSFWFVEQFAPLMCKTQNAKCKTAVSPSATILIIFRRKHLPFALCALHFALCDSSKKRC